MWKLCSTWPTFLKEKVTFPGLRIDFLARSNENSLPRTLSTAALRARLWLGQGSRR